MTPKPWGYKMEISEAMNLLKQGNSFKSIKDESIKYLGNRTYSCVDCRITKVGASKGWKYKYPCLQYDGVMFLKAGKSIEKGILDGNLEFYKTTSTHCG